MELDGARGHGERTTTRPSTPLPHPRPHHPPFDLPAWVAAPRPEAPPGIYRQGYQQVDPEQAEEAKVPTGPLLLRAALNVVATVATYYIGTVVLMYAAGFLLRWFDGTSPDQFNAVQILINLVTVSCAAAVFWRTGRWREVARRFLTRAGWRQNIAPVLARAITHEGSGPVKPTASPEVPPVADPWFAQRVGGASAAAGRLDGEAVGDVDYVRIQRAWESAQADHVFVPAFVEQVMARGAAAFSHPSGSRELTGRVAHHDLLVQQVRLGTTQDVPKNPQTYRTTGFALDPTLLGTSLLAVGPAGTGKTARLARPAVEALCLQALAGTACVVAIGAADADLGPDSWYDVVIAPGESGSVYGLDLYGSTQDPDEAAARLADALLPDELTARAESARMALQQVVGPFHAAYGRYPGVRELRGLLSGEADVRETLVKALRAAGRLATYERDLEHRDLQRGRADDPGALLADRLALLDRPAFEGAFMTDGTGRPPFAMRALDHPLRVRVKLPERSHPEAARMLSRLVVGQFVLAAAAREDRSLFAGLVVDDASAALDASTVRGLQRMRGANAGAVLLLRTLMDLPEVLRTPLFGAVGCRMVFPGIAPWDGKFFSEAWGTHVIHEKVVTHAPLTEGGALRRAGRLGRKALSGTTAQTESVTTRDVERLRWSPSDLAHALPAGHAVVSLTAVSGEQVPPLLVDLRG
ncbi:ATP-binding protein [Streptomyces sp. CB01881]|uniref:ATP-binding protein n=1 Tax=Streptomyces sp. CB01881 TaxID=2078691 RepID=UPI000CDC93F2|nr:ATP-binding protein [Streptomyces sp. CB01881]AUY51706.1 ATP-binding protein [Streptomyces sp. CB01881]TYC71133.1 ATP-binding protein [Streptomyces sp. CB01881]